MDCKKAQRLFDDLARERLAPDVAVAVRQHLTDCTDCRVSEQRAARLQRLLALKRYECPSPEYFSNFLAEFHNRLLAETQPRARWWERAWGGMDDFLLAKSMQVWRHGLASAMGVVVVAGLVWMGLREIDDPAGSIDQMAAVNPPLMMTQIPLPASQSTPVAATVQLVGLTHGASEDYQSAVADSVAVAPAAARTESTPQYVLDRISVTPASYDVPNVHF